MRFSTGLISAAALFQVVFSAPVNPSVAHTGQLQARDTATLDIRGISPAQTIVDVPLDVTNHYFSVGFPVNWVSMSGPTGALCLVLFTSGDILTMKPGYSLGFEADTVTGASCKLYT